MVEIKNARWTPVDMWTHLECSMKIKQRRLSDASSSSVTWQNLSALSSIKPTQLNDNDLHPSISLEPLIENEEPNPTTMPNLAYQYTCSSTM